MKNAGSFVILLLFCINLQLKPQNGEEIFKSNCASCHTIGKGKLVGPDLSGIYNKKDVTWISGFIRASQDMVKSGDPDAVAIFNEFNKIPMPNNNLNDQQVNALLDYIKKTDEQTGAVRAPADSSGAKGDTAKVAAAGGEAAVTDTLVITKESLELGNSLFYGYSRFANGAAPCVSCHNIADVSVLGGGKLARDLTTAYSRLSPQGINAILMNPPFPAMKSAIPGKLTDEEIKALDVLLKSVDENSTIMKASPAGMMLIMMGCVCAMFLFVFTFILYDERKIPDRRFPESQ